jgi:Trk K+ transport system NAD-binding subunit
VAADSDPGLAGQCVAAVHQPGTLRVIALRRPDISGVDWSPDAEYVIRPGDRLVVLATRAGLSRILRPEPQA